MRLTIDGIITKTEYGATIYDVLRSLSLDSLDISKRPLGAMINGEVFSLRYKPYRSTDIKLLRYGDDEGRRIYERSMLFVVLTALKKLYPNDKAIVRYSLGGGLYLTLDMPVNEDIINKIKYECDNIISNDIPFIRRRMRKSDAISYFEQIGEKDKVELLRWRKIDYFDVYRIGEYGYEDYFYGELVPSTGYLSIYSLQLINEEQGAFIILLPDYNEPTKTLNYELEPQFARVLYESELWGNLMNCSDISQLNEHIKNGTIKELIRVNEALHEKTYAFAADEIVKRNAKAIMISGPSSSGKTTSANRIATQLRVLGKNPIMISLDNYYLDRDAIPANEYGEKDFENINALDVDRFNSDLASLLKGKKTKVPIFNFKTGKRDEKFMEFELDDNQPIIIEGIHGLNPMLISDDIDESKIMKIYVSALTTMNIDDHNRIKTTDIRLLRRLVRDYRTRNASMDVTLSMWKTVVNGEKTWIFPYQECADLFLNTTLVYEIAVLKKYVYPLLKEVVPESPNYMAARNLVKFLNYFEDVNDESDIPPTSIIKEFIGGNTFYND